jgi:hypothetical protein
MKLENLVPSLSDPGGLTQGILGAILGKKETSDSGQKPQGEAAEAKKEPGAPATNPLEDVLGAILGQQQKKKEQKPSQPAPQQQPAEQEQKPPAQPK